MTTGSRQRGALGRADPFRAAALTVAAVLAAAVGAQARSAGDPIVLHFEEGDVGGVQTVWDEDGEQAIGMVEYRQRRQGDELHTHRIARFADGSSDEELAVARVVDGRLEALRGHQIQRDDEGYPVLEVDIDVEGDRVQAQWGPRDDRETMDQSVALPSGTYWGPLVFLVLKNFAANAEDGKVVFRTVAPTPRPRVIDLELVHGGVESLERPGHTVRANRFRLRPTLHWLLDPLLALVVPDTSFWTLPGEPPGLALFTGPRSYRRDRIVLR